MNTIFSDKEKKYTIYSCQRIENMLNSFLILKMVIRLGGEESLKQLSRGLPRNRGHDK